MDCKECRDHMDAYVKKALAPEALEAIERHLAGCAGCREELEQARRLHGLLSAWQVPPSRPGFETRLAARLREAQTQKQRHSAWLGWPAWSSVAALLLVALGSVLWWRSSQMNPQKTEEQVTLTVAQDLELYENLELLQDLDLFENWDEIETVDPKVKKPS
jgi:anti-sigma factor RsiW